MIRGFWTKLSIFLAYPDATSRDRIVDGGDEPEAAGPSERLAEFRQAVERTPLESLQDLYIRTFDRKPGCTLDVGHHLFGEDYRRGVFLAGLRELQRNHDIDARPELPDHLPVLLRLLDRLEAADEVRRDLLEVCLLPATETIVSNLASSAGPYTDLLVLVGELLRHEAGEAAQTCRQEVTV